jgi:hypothetical protein
MRTPPLPQRGFMQPDDRRTMGVMGTETLFFTAGNKAYFEMSIAPNLELVSVVRQFIGNFYAQVYGDPDTIDRVALAAHELLENAVKYSIDGSTTLRMDIVTGPTISYVIRTRNRATPDDARILKSRLDELNASGDVDAHYMSLLARSAKTKTKKGGGLGLGRVASEAEMELSFSVDDSMLVELSARTREVAA